MHAIGDDEQNHLPICLGALSLHPRWRTALLHPQAAAAKTQPYFEGWCLLLLLEEAQALQPLSLS